MQLNLRGTSALTRLGLLVMVSAAWQAHAHAQNAETPYPSMAPLDQYLMERNAEIALARSAAPESISRDAEVLVLGRHGYESADKGKNGFVCMVERSWTAGIDDPDFWNPKLRAAYLLQRACRANLPSHHHQEDCTGIGRTIKSADISRYQNRLRQEGTAAAGNRRDVLHDVQRIVLERP